MFDATEARRAALRKFLQDHGGFARVVEQFSLTQSQASYLSQLTAQESVASFGERSAVNWEGRLGIKDGRLVNAGRLQIPIEQQSNVEAAPQMRPRKGIPVVGEVKGGDDGYLDEMQYPVGHGEGTVDYPTADPNAYALRVRGDSMHPRYRAGEFIVVEPSIEAQPGDDVVVALRDGRKLLKELNWKRDGEVQLLSVNNHFGPLTLQDSEIQFIQLVAGRVRRSAMNKA